MTRHVQKLWAMSTSGKAGRLSDIAAQSAKWSGHIRNRSMFAYKVETLCTLTITPRSPTQEKYHLCPYKD